MSALIRQILGVITTTICIFIPHSGLGQNWMRKLFFQSCAFWWMKVRGTWGCWDYVTLQMICGGLKKGQDLRPHYQSSVTQAVIAMTLIHTMWIAIFLDPPTQMVAAICKRFRSTSFVSCFTSNSKNLSLNISGCCNLNTFGWWSTVSEANFFQS